jgi:predicted carbohydrate-binding protein with CBM5 and CBM33 domain
MLVSRLRLAKESSITAHDKQAEAVATFGLRQVEIAGERFEEETSKSWPSVDIAAGHSGQMTFTWRSQ